MLLLFPVYVQGRNLARVVNIIKVTSVFPWYKFLCVRTSNFFNLLSFPQWAVAWTLEYRPGCLSETPGAEMLASWQSYQCNAGKKITSKPGNSNIQFVSACKTNWFFPCFKDFVSENLGQRFIEPQVRPMRQFHCRKYVTLTFWSVVLTAFRLLETQKSTFRLL